MKKFTLKSKIVTGVVVASVIGSSTFALANTNAGTQFTAWGNTQITNAKSAVTTAIGNSRNNAVNTFKSQSESKRDTALGNINTAGTNEKTQTKSAIEDKLAEHVASLNAALTTFLNAIGADFDSMVTAENGKTYTALDSQYQSLASNINSVLTAAKNANVKSVTEESLLVKGQATSDLIKEINKVKADLAARILSEKNTAQGEVDVYLADEVTRVTNLINSLISTLESGAKTDIETAGNTVEASAIANFERVISRLKEETPLKIDPQKLKWEVTQMLDGKVKFTVENKNEFDVVFKYSFVSLGNNEGGVSQTPFAQSNAKPGETTLIFDAFDFPVPGTQLEIQWLDHNGVWQKVDKVGPF
jgi:hypothetical protein